MNVPNRARRDWSLIIFIIPLGILLIIIVGQIAIRILPNWSVNANMRSNLDPNSAPGQPAFILQPLLPQIMTPMGWIADYLNQGSDFTFPPFFVFEPTASPSPTPVSPTPATPSPTATTPAPTTTVVVTSTTKPPNGETPTSTTEVPTTEVPTTEVPTTEAPPTGYPVTIDPSYGTPAPIPTQINVGGGPDNPYNVTPISTAGIGQIQDGTYIVIPLSVEVGLTPDANYDLVYYEFNNGGYAYLDWIIIGLSNFEDGSSYYEVFNWGNNIPDTNSNVDTNTLSPPPPANGNPCDPPEAPECDDREVELDDLYDPDGGNNSNSTGVLIDVDTATSGPPPGTYNYIVIISPNDGLTGGPADIDAIDTVEVPIPP